jgi:hypothetical protein
MIMWDGPASEAALSYFPAKRTSAAEAAILFAAVMQGWKPCSTTNPCHPERSRKRRTQNAEVLRRFLRMTPN